MELKGNISENKEKIKCLSPQKNVTEPISSLVLGEGESNEESRKQRLILNGHRINAVKSFS